MFIVRLAYYWAELAEYTTIHHHGMVMVNSKEEGEQIKDAFQKMIVLDYGKNELRFQCGVYKAEEDSAKFLTDIEAEILRLQKKHKHKKKKQ